MREIEEILKSVVTIEDGLRVIANLENKPKDLSGKNKKNHNEFGIGLLDEFKEIFYRMPIVGLTLATEPSYSFLTKLRDWFSQNLGQNVIIDLKIDPEIVAGAKIICQEHYKDFSLASKIDEFLNKQERVEVDDNRLMPSTMI